MKICFIIASLSNGGAERALVNLANEFVKENAVNILKFEKEKSFYALDKRIVLKTLPQFKWHNIYHKISSRFKKILLLRKMMKKIQADVYISFLDTTNIACIFASFGLKLKLIISEHSTQSYLKSKFWRLLRRIAYPYASALTVLSAEDKKYYEKFVHRVEIFFNICNFKPCQTMSKEKLVLFVGRLDKNKNAVLFLKMISFLPQYIQKEYEFCIVGEGEEKENLQNLAQKLGIEVKFLGRIKHIQELYKRAEFLCLCSFIEGLPSVLVESLFFKVLRISTNYTNSASDLIKNNIDGFIVPQNDAKAMALKLSFLIENEKEKQRLIHNAFSRCKDFEPEFLVQKWQKFIMSLKEQK